jgi:hypothetical protein
MLIINNHQPIFTLNVTTKINLININSIQYYSTEYLYITLHRLTTKKLRQQSNRLKLKFGIGIEWFFSRFLSLSLLHK